MTRARSIALLVIAAVAIGGAYLAYDNILRGDDVAPLALPSTAPTPTDGAVSTAPTSVVPGSLTPGSGADGEIAGTWTVAEGSEAGYRVRERLASLPAESDAVGRTKDVTGSVTLSATDGGIRLAAGTVDVDTTSIRSDEARRDARMRTDGLETDRFPTATFTVTEPVEITTGALEGGAQDVVLGGDLTLHGVTKAVRIPAQAQLIDDQIQVVGSITFPLADFDIVAPNVGGFILSIADEGTLEFLLVLAKA